MDNPYNQSDFLQGMDVVCFSHLRWSFVYQRPQHLLSRFAKYTRVFYMEEPIFYHGINTLELTKHGESGLYVAVPYLQHELPPNEVKTELARMIDGLLQSENIKNYCAWYYTPMAISFTEHLKPDVTVFDCMDELSAFKFAPAELKALERQLLNKADVVFTGGHSIYEAKKNSHANIHSFPSSIDKEHFGQARHIKIDPPDQQHIPHPRFGFFGVIDERFDIGLVEQVAKEKPGYQFVIIGPVVKIDPETLPKLDNIHYLGGKNYNELPHYLSGWDVAIITFAINESTRFISPTKTPEYLAGGKPVISTAIADVINPYGENNLVHIVGSADAFIKAADAELQQKDKQAWLEKADAFLKDISWDNTWNDMVTLIHKNVSNKISNNLKKPVYV